MYLIMNERKYAEFLLDNGTLGDSTSIALFVLAKYYAQVKGMKKKAIITELDNMMEAAYPGYIAANWESMLEKAAKQATKYPLVELDGIPVTQKELDTIDTLNYSSEKKLAFTLLVLAKFFNATRSTNNDWVNCEPKVVFKYANVNKGQVEQARMYSVLTKAGLLMYSNKTGSVNARVTFVDNDGDAVCVVPDLRDLGHEYMRINGANYSRCQCCNLLVKQPKTKGRPKVFCDDCMKLKMESRSFSIWECIDCGCDVYVANHNHVSRDACRCPECKLKERRRLVRQSKLKFKDAAETGIERKMANFDAS